MKMRVALAVLLFCGAPLAVMAEDAPNETHTCGPGTTFVFLVEASAPKKATVRKPPPLGSNTVTEKKPPVKIESPAANSTPGKIESSAANSTPGRIAPPAFNSASARMDTPPPPVAPFPALDCGDQKKLNHSLGQLYPKNLWADRLGSLIEGERFERDWSLGEARKAYVAAMTSKQPIVSTCAALSQERVAGLQSELLWPLRWFPPIEWFKQDTRKGYVYCTLPAGLLLTLVFAWSKSARRGVHLSAPVCVAGELPVGLFAAELRSAMLEVRELIDSEARGHQMSGSVALSLSNSEISKSVLDALPNVLGLDVGKILPAILSVYRYFFVKLETSVAMSATEIRCYSSLKRAWRTLDSWDIHVSVTPVSGNALPIGDVAMAARLVAYFAAARCADPLIGTR